MLKEKDAGITQFRCENPSLKVCFLSYPLIKFYGLRVSSNIAGRISMSEKSDLTDQSRN